MLVSTMPPLASLYVLGSSERSLPSLTHTQPSLCYHQDPGGAHSSTPISRRPLPITSFCSSSLFSLYFGAHKSCSSRQGFASGPTLLSSSGRHFYVSVERGTGNGERRCGERRGIKFSKILKPILELFLKC